MSELYIPATVFFENYYHDMIELMMEYNEFKIEFLSVSGLTPLFSTNVAEFNSRAEGIEFDFVSGMVRDMVFVFEIGTITVFNDYTMM